MQAGLFSKPGQQFDALIRFSNADVNAAKSDSALNGSVVVHGSRGMAVKVLGVTGTPLLTTNLVTSHGPFTQDFLMINQPVFAFANVEDYQVLSQVLVDKNDDAAEWAPRRLAIGNALVTKRVVVTGGIIKRIMSNVFPAASPPSPPAQPTPAAYHAPPRSPLDNRYFGAAPFLFGPGRVLKFSANPVSPEPGEQPADFLPPGYLRSGLQKRLNAAHGRNIEFDF